MISIGKANLVSEKAKKKLIETFDKNKSKILSKKKQKKY